MTEGKQIISNDAGVAETMNVIFVTITDSRGINENSHNENTSERIMDSVDNVVQTVSNDPSILKIKGHYQNTSLFAFQKVTSDPIDKHVRNLNPKNATRHRKISILEFLNQILKCVCVWSL